MPNTDVNVYVESLLSDPKNPLVVFAIEWCEFCWAVKKLFKAIRVPFKAVELDSAEYLQDGLGGRIRTALEEKTGSATVPQVFIAGQYIGGATNTLDAWKEGQLQKWLEEAGLAYQHDENLNPYEFLPGWLHNQHSP